MLFSAVPGCTRDRLEMVYFSKGRERKQFPLFYFLFILCKHIQAYPSIGVYIYILYICRSCGKMGCFALRYTFQITCCLLLYLLLSIHELIHFLTTTGTVIRQTISMFCTICIILKTQHTHRSTVHLHSSWCYHIYSPLGPIWFSHNIRCIDKNLSKSQTQTITTIMTL